MPRTKATFVRDNACPSEDSKVFDAYNAQLPYYLHHRVETTTNLSPIGYKFIVVFKYREEARFSCFYRVFEATPLRLTGELKCNSPVTLRRSA